MATVALFPICPSASPSPTVVVVLPSPRGVGVIAETTTYFARGLPLSSSIASSLIFATSCPYGSSRCGSMPILPAISGIGSNRALRAISRSVGNSTFIHPLLAKLRDHLATPALRRLDLVEREDMQAGHTPVRGREVWHQGADEPPRIVAAGTEHARDPARVATQEARRIRHTDPGRESQQPRRVGDAGQTDVDRKLDTTTSHPLDPSLHTLRVEAHVADDVGRQ